MHLEPTSPAVQWVSMSMVRAFVAVELPRDIRERLQDLSGRLQEKLSGLPLRWLPIDNIHLTLKFLGDISQTNVEVIAGILQAEVQSLSKFEIGVGGLGAFPSMQRPRVIWVGVQAPEDFVQLQQRIESECGRLGYPTDRRPFSPHLTLARVKRRARHPELKAIGKALRTEEFDHLGMIQADEVTLFRSELKASGAVYSKLYSAAFGNPP